MPPKTDQWVDAVVKLTELTQEGKLEWSIDPYFEDQHAIGPTYRATHGDKSLRLRKRSILRPSKRGWDEEWQEQYLLEFVGQNDQVLWAFPEIDAIQHLYGAVQYQTAGVKDFLNDLLK